MVGTPLMDVTFSASMIRRASPASHLYMSTMVPPAAVVAYAPQLFAVTWNRGVVRRATGTGTGAFGSGATPVARWVARACACPENTMLKRLATQPRWVSWAPFGKPVVPEV